MRAVRLEWAQCTKAINYNLRPRRPFFRRVLSVGIGVTSSIRPIFMSLRARARNADWAPGPGVFVLLPPVPLILMCKALIPTSCKEMYTTTTKKTSLLFKVNRPIHQMYLHTLQRSATSWAANIAAYGELSSLSALTFIPPVTREIVSRPEISVTCCNYGMKWVNNLSVVPYQAGRWVLTTKVSLNEAKIWATPNTNSPSLTFGPRRTTSSTLFSVFFFFDCIAQVPRLSCFHHSYVRSFRVLTIFLLPECFFTWYQLSKSHRHTVYPSWLPA